MSALPSLSPQEQAARYEQHITENWNSLSPFEQEQARSYMDAKMHASQAQFQSMQSAQPGIPAAQPGFGQPQFASTAYGQPAYGQPAYGYGDPLYGGYGPGAFGPPKQEVGGGWAVPVGYVGLLIFTPLAIFCGIYNITKGRSGHGIAQLVIAGSLILLTLVAISAG